ncbi:MAG: histidine kinase [Bacteroidales bacterium]|nr:histidine kinase [Bacteroidales bacterium]
MRFFLPFIVLVLIHHFLLAPLIRKKLPLYIGLTMALLVLFGIWSFSPFSRPNGAPPFPEDKEMMPPPPSLDGRGPVPQGRRGPISPEVTRLFVGILLIGVDLGAFFYVDSRRKERRMKELEAENTKQRLESLRYQINPHFFMNTLNNIHALVDIDPEKAKESIEEFSKMMRILLYEGDAPTIPLERELGFIEHFISLMRLRYTEDALRIETIFPEEKGGAVVPPLVMASFVENAFKHGVSYAEESFIRVKVELQDGKVVFHCANSSHPAEGDDRHGIGLENIKKRLTLLYGKSYTLSIDEDGGRYDVLLAVPDQTVFQVS